MKISIITASYNSAKYLDNCINSIMSQSHKDIEYIVIDGASTDKTLSLLNSRNNQITKLVSEKDNGIYDAMNKGINISKNDIIVFCNSGDFFYKNSLKKVIQIFNSKNVDYVFGTVVRNYTKKKIIKFSLNPKRVFYNFDFATAHSTGFFLKRDVYKIIGLYDLKFKCSSDFDLYFRMVKKGFIGSVTKKKDLIGNVASGGFSSKISFFEHLIEETKIRLKNKQNFIFIVIIFINAILKRMLKNLF